MWTGELQLKGRYLDDGRKIQEVLLLESSSISREASGPGAAVHAVG